MGPAGEKLMQTMAAMTDDEMDQIERMMNGEFENDLLRRGDVSDAIRSLRINHAGDRPYQQALTDLSRMMSKLKTRGE